MIGSVQYVEEYTRQCIYLKSFLMNNKEWRYVMVDLKKYADIYVEIKKLTDSDTLQLVLESEDDEVKDFYEMVGDFLLQQSQREIVSKNLF